MQSKQFDYLESLTKASREWNKLKDDLKQVKQNDMNLLQLEEIRQQPTIQAIKEMEPKATELAKLMKQQNVPNVLAISTAPSAHIVPLDFKSSGSKYSLIKTNELNEVSGLPYWKFNTTSRGNIGKWLCFAMGAGEYIWDREQKTQPIELTDGLKEILFNDANNTDIITRDDFNDWLLLIDKSGLRSHIEKTILYKKIKDNVLTEVVGDGIITIPSAPEQLCKQLELQLQAHAAGHKGTFNTVNAILKELMSQKLIKSKMYRSIIRKYYHV